MRTRQDLRPRVQKETDPWAISIPPVSIANRVHEEEHMLLWQVRGYTDLLIDGEPLQLLSGQAVWIPAGAWHSLVVGANSVLLPLEFPVNIIATTLSQVTVFNVDRDLGTPLLAFLQSQGSIICAEVNLARQILALIEQSPIVANTLPLPQHPQARRVAALLIANPGDDRTVAQLAATMHVSGRTLERAFLAETGMTLGQWRLQNRMECAAELFKSIDNIAAVAARVGYMNVSAFGRVFKSHFLLTPGEYIERHARGY